MESIANQQTERRFNIAYICLFFILFLVAPSYYQDNPGGEGLFLPFNNIVWITVCFLIGLALLKIIYTGFLILPGMTKSILFFLIATTLVGLITSVATPISWLFRSLAIWGGILFFFAFAQFNLERYNRENLLVIVALSAGLQSVYALIQILITPIPTWLPQVPGLPVGIFQQTNLLASYSATGLILSCYLLTLPSLKQRSLLLKSVLILVIVLTTSSVITSGSRVGLIGLIAGYLLILLCRYQQIINYKNWFITAFFAIALSTVSSTFLPAKTGGLTASLDKFNTMVDPPSEQTLEKPTSLGSVRYSIYDSSIELILDKPFLGYGIGQFQRVWHEKKIEYTKLNPDADILSVRLSHPHNELLYWAIEGGGVALSGIVAMIVSFLFCCWRVGWQRGGAYLAILLPITLHSQLELPFYISHLHWILFVLLIAIVASHEHRIYKIQTSSALKVTGLTLAFAFPVISSSFFTHSLFAVDRIVDITFKKAKNLKLLDLPSNNIYFNERATLIKLQVMLHVGLQNNDHEALRQYEAMARDLLTYIPDPPLYKGLALALYRMERYEESHQILAYLMSMYPTAPDVKQFQLQVMELDKKQGIFDKYWKLKPVQQPE